MTLRAPSTTQELYRRIKHIRRVETLYDKVVNDLWAGPKHLVAHSHQSRTHRDRVIQYGWILDPSYCGRHASLVRALQRILGIKRTQP